MLEDLFSVVKVRFNGDKADDDKKKKNFAGKNRMCGQIFHR